MLDDRTIVLVLLIMMFFLGGGVALSVKSLLDDLSESFTHRNCQSHRPTYIMCITCGETMVIDLEDEQC